MSECTVEEFQHVIADRNAAPWRRRITTRDHAATAKAEGRWADAKRLYTNALLETPECAELWRARALVQINLGYPHFGASDATRALKLESHYDAHYLIGRAHSVMTDYPTALTHLKLAEKLSGEAPVQTRLDITRLLSETEANKNKGLTDTQKLTNGSCMAWCAAARARDPAGRHSWR